MSKPIGFILTIAGLLLAVWFVQIVTAPRAPLQAFVVAAIAAAMISVGIRYILKSRPKKKKTEGTGT